MLTIYQNPPREQWSQLTARAVVANENVDQIVGAILARVRRDGDEALRALTYEIDGVDLSSIEVSPEEFARARQCVEQPLRQAIAQAAANIETFHRAQLHSDVDVFTQQGVRCMQRSVPVRSVGLYVPGGSAPLLSTVLMLAIPARVAGCESVVLCTPAAKDGSVAAAVLFAAQECGISRVFKVGGAQAIGAMAYGTATIPRVDKIFGPGNRFVTKAKQLVSVADTAIDMPAGASEVMIMADDSCRPDFVAADMLSQAEHGPDSQAMVVCDSIVLARQIESAVSERLQLLPRREIASKALGNSRIIVIPERERMVEFANAYAPEHLIVAMREPWRIVDGITAAGSVFVGNYSPESAGDYASGTNHTLPTSGWARAFSGVGTDSFMRRMTVQELSCDGLNALSDTIVAMARAEGLEAHAKAVEIRIENGTK